MDIQEMSSADTFAGQEILDRIEELEDEQYDALDYDDHADPIEWAGSARDVEMRELNNAIQHFSYSQIRDCTLIHESHFETWIRETSDDGDNVDHPLANYMTIDWERYAHDMSSDYTVIEFDATTFYVEGV